MEAQALCGLGENRKKFMQNKHRTVNNLLNFPIDSHIFPCYTINNTGINEGSKELRKSFLFMDTIYNKVDAKGRVSLPSDYRAIVKELSTEIVCYRSLSSPCIEGCTEELLEKLASEMETSLDFFSQTQDDLTNLIFGDARRFTFDSTGRISLSEKLLKHAEITDTAVFVGKGRKFQIWNPENWAKEEARIRAEVLKNRPSLRPSGGADE
mgnify:CR=1 FL=1